nr:MAG TPA: 4Fe-4S dicluster domain protein [Caudoviricetes sp.]
MVNFVATTHPMGKKRCKRCDACLTVCLNIYKSRKDVKR